MERTFNIETEIERERKALYACSRGKCRECPLKQNSNTYCMTKLLQNFNKIIERLRSN